MAKTLFTTKKALETRNAELEAQNKTLLAEIEALKNAKKAPENKEDNTMTRNNFKLNKRHENMIEKIINGGTSTTTDKKFATHLKNNYKDILVTDLGDGKYELKLGAKSTKSTKKNAPKNTEEETKELRIWEYKGKVDFTKATLNVLLPYFEPKKYDGHYRWGNMKHDGYNQKSYCGRRKAFCVYMATDGKYWDSQKAYDAGIRIDYSEGGTYKKAKAEFEKKFKYVKKEDRQ